MACVIYLQKKMWVTISDKGYPQLRPFWATRLLERPKPENVKYNRQRLEVEKHLFKIRKI